MNLNIKVVDEVPESRYRRGPRESACLQIIKEAEKVHPKMIELTSDDKDEVQRVYKSLLQWKQRHKDHAVNIRKNGLQLYVWTGREGPA